MNRQELEKILDNPPNINNKKIYIWGTGNTSALYQESINRLEKEGSLYITGYTDNNSEKWDGQFFNKPIISPQELKAQSDICVLICSPQPQVINAVKQQLKELHIEGYHIDEVILKLHKKELLQCFDLLEDAESKEVYSHIIMCRIKGEYPDNQFISSEQYFQLREFYQRNPNEIFIDCGAFVGDTIERYIWKKDGVFHKIIAFEPDAENYRAMEIRINRLEKEWNIPSYAFAKYPYGISDKNATLKVTRYAANNGLSSKIVETELSEGEECRIIAIDDFIKEPFTFLKADIEGYEYKMLMGAQKSIVKYTPKLAICIYHSSADLYDIPLLIKSIEPRYKIKIRHYSNFLDETVLYAWVE